MGSGRRISLALAGLVLLAVIGWLVTHGGDHATGHTTQDEHRPAVSTSAPVTPASAPRRASASG